MLNPCRPRSVLIILSAVACTWLAAGAGVSTNAQEVQAPRQTPTGYVNDYAGVIDRSTKSRLETTLGNLNREQQIEFAVVTVDSTGGQEIFDYSLAVARGWGIGSKDTGKPSLLLLVAIKDRKYFTQVSRHLEGDLPDGLAGQIQREQLVPAFRQEQYGKGLSDTVESYIKVIATKKGFSTDTIFSDGSSSEPVRSAPEASREFLFIGIFIIAIIVVIVLASRGRNGRNGRHRGNGLYNLLLLNMLANRGRGSGPGGWMGGGFGGSGGSCGGGFGGFGGGGDFGGGGAGGGW